MLFTIFLKVPVQIQSKVKSKLMFSFQCLPFLSIVVSSVYVQEQIVRLVTNKGCLFVKPTIYLHLKVKLLIQSHVQVASPGVQDQPSKVTHDWQFLLHRWIVVILHFRPIEQLFNSSLSWIKNR